jgi:two-component system KDP operon response regulator KdpE
MSRARILFVDDDPQIRRMMRTILTSQGFDFTDAWSGSTGMEKLRSSKYDLAILDINMPGINGIETCRMMRAVSDLPIIMLTVRKGERDKAEAYEAGANDYVIKPFSTPELPARIRATLRRK